MSFQICYISVPCIYLIIPEAFISSNKKEGSFERILNWIRHETIHHCLVQIIADIVVFSNADHRVQ